MDPLLALARKHVVEGEQRIARQMEIIDRLDALGAPIALAQELLDVMMVSFRHMVEDRDHIERVHLLASNADATDPLSGLAAVPGPPALPA